MIVDLLGFSAGAAVLTCFWMRDQRRLRGFGILSNILFILYGALTGMLPIVILHTILLPLNILRLSQLSSGYKSGAS